jgi:hypothetical protein
MVGGAESEWQKRYEISVAREDADVNSRPQGLVDITIRVRAYFLEAMLLLVAIAGSVAMIRTGHPWPVAIGIALLVVALLIVAGFVAGWVRRFR